ncbi:MAG: helix-turn-helix domain-containing protein [Planctomycetaceae bacterium]
MSQAATISDTLRGAIAASGMTHYRLAQEAGIRPQMLDYFVRGERGLRIETIDKLAPVLGLELRPHGGNRRRRPR